MQVSEHILAGMDSVGLDEIGSHALMNRVDTKYVFGVDRLATLLEGVSDDYRVLQVRGEAIAPYTTLYFDTIDRRCYLRHHNGQRTRQKVRIRQYRSTGEAFLEVKEKDNKGRTLKSRLPVPGFSEVLSREQQDFVDQITGRGNQWTPTLLTEFRRIALVHKNCAERVTIDLDLTFARDIHARNGSVLRVPGLVIAEVKQESDNRRSSLRAKLKQMGNRPTRMSKYCIGSALLDPGLKRNRFKSQLRTILEKANAE